MKATNMARRGRHPLLRSVLAAALALGAALATAPTAWAQNVKSAEEVAAAVAKTYGVEVLRITTTEVDGRPAYRVTVMNQGGNSDSAFRVTTLVVDAATGALVPQFRHKAAGYDLPGASSNTPPSEEDGMAMRRMTYR